MIKKSCAVAACAFVLVFFQSCDKGSNISEADKASSASNAPGKCSPMGVTNCTGNKVQRILKDTEGCDVAVCQDPTVDTGMCGAIEHVSCSEGQFVIAITDHNECAHLTCSTGNGPSSGGGGSNPPPYTPPPYTPPTDGGGGGTPPGDGGGGTPSDGGGGTPPGSGGGGAQTCTIHNGVEQIKINYGSTQTRTWLTDVMSKTDYSTGGFGRNGRYCMQARYSCSNSGQYSGLTLYIHLSTNDLYNSLFDPNPTSSYCTSLMESKANLLLSWKNSDYEAVKGFYREYLGREFDRAGMEYYFYDMIFRNQSLSQVEGSIRNSNEAQTNRAKVGACYYEHLLRAPDQAGLDWWTALTELPSNHQNYQSVSEVCNGLAGSKEGRIIDCYQQYSNRPQSEWSPKAQQYRDSNHTVAQVCTMIQNGTD